MKNYSKSKKGKRRVTNFFCFDTVATQIKLKLRTKYAFKVQSVSIN